jgi:hypothetical protein
VALAESRLQQALILAAALCTGIGLVAAALLPRHSAESPQRLNLRYYLDADTQRAQWIADPAAGPLPALLLQAAPFALSAQPLFAWSGPMWIAPAPRLPMSAPQLSVLSAVRVAARVHYRIHIGSARAAPIIGVAFPPEATVSSVQLEGDATPALAATPRRIGNGWSQLRLFSVPPAGQDLSFDASGSAFSLKLLDESPGLPAPGAALQRARPSVAVPSHGGDVTIVTRDYRLQP